MMIELIFIGVNFDGVFEYDGLLLFMFVECFWWVVVVGVFDYIEKNLVCGEDLLLYFVLVDCYVLLICVIGGIWCVGCDEVYVVEIVVVGVCFGSMVFNC